MCVCVGVRVCACVCVCACVFFVTKAISTDWVFPRDLWLDAQHPQVGLSPGSMARRQIFRRSRFFPSALRAKSLFHSYLPGLVVPSCPLLLGDYYALFLKFAVLVSHCIHDLHTVRSCNDQTFFPNLVVEFFCSALFHFFLGCIF